MLHEKDACIRKQRLMARAALCTRKQVTALQYMQFLAFEMRKDTQIIRAKIVSMRTSQKWDRYVN